MRATGVIRLARAAGMGVSVAVFLTGCAVLLTACAKVARHITVYQTDDRGGLYPAGTISGEPTYHVGWRIFR